MSTERRQAEERLLADTFSDAPSGMVGKSAALKAFRRALFLRRAGHVAVIAVIGGLVTTAALRWSRTGPPVAEPMHAARMVEFTPAPQPIPRMADGDLLALFPSNSCFLGEVDGRVVLVFTDPDLRREFIHDFE